MLWDCDIYFNYIDELKSLHRAFQVKIPGDHAFEAFFVKFKMYFLFSFGLLIYIFWISLGKTY